jgi:hypothetical protein
VKNNTADREIWAKKSNNNNNNKARPRTGHEDPEGE